MTNEINYTLRLTARNGKAYDEANAFVGQNISHHCRFEDGYTYYFVDKEEISVIRVNGENRRIEISDSVDKEVIASILHILNTEIRGPDL